MLHALPTSWLSSHFRLESDGRDIGRLALAAIRERATFTVKDVEFSFYRESMAGDFVLDFQGSVLARAQKTSVLKRQFTLTFEDQSYTLSASSAFGRAFVLSEGEAEVGRVRPLKMFSNKAEIDLPDAVPLPVQVFCFWLVVVLWKRAEAAASG
jgi:hypothetical protein